MVMYGYIWVALGSFSDFCRIRINRQLSDDQIYSLALGCANVDGSRDRWSLKDTRLNYVLSSSCPIDDPELYRFVPLVYRAIIDFALAHEMEKIEYFNEMVYNIFLDGGA